MSHIPGSSSVPVVDLELLSEPSSSNQTSDDLAAFRQQWIQELQDNLRIRESLGRREVANSTSSSENERKTLARSLYQIGIAEERAGNPFKAVNFYARACRLFPDIDQEFRVFHDSPKSSDTATPVPETDDDATVDQMSSNLVSMTLRDDSEQNTEDKPFVLCEPTESFNPGTTHISKMPFEVMLMILHHVAFPDFDFKSVENCGMVCKGFRFLAREPEIWQKACVKVWGDLIPQQFANLTWREMYVKRPRLNYHGVYISKVIYTRQGEQSFDNAYMILQTVEYFRYLRFFPDGQVLMYTSPEEPKLVVPKLKYPSCRLSGIKRGSYQLHENNAVISLNDDERPQATTGRVSKLRNPQPYYENMFSLTLTISAMGHKKPSCKLSWVSYSVQTKKITPLMGNRLDLTGQNSEVHLGPVTDFNIHSSQFKPFIFSLVRSYTAVPNI